MKSFDLRRLIESRRTTLVCLGLAVATAGVYWRLRYCDFTNYDDYFMLVHNPMVSGGLSGQGILWAFSTSWFEYWHPLTWLSHMLDYELFGPSPGWQHLASLGCHVANTVMLFVVLRRMSGVLWRSAMVAALFGLHPLHVESVAWLAERKDVLSAFFFMLTLWAYVRYAEVQSLQSKVQSRVAEVENPKSNVQSPESENAPPSGVSSSRFEVQYSMFDVRPFSLGFWYGAGESRSEGQLPACRSVQRRPVAVWAGLMQLHNEGTLRRPSQCPGM